MTSLQYGIADGATVWTALKQAKHEASQAALSKMSAGELFRIEEDCDSEHCEV